MQLSRIEKVNTPETTLEQKPVKSLLLSSVFSSTSSARTLFLFPSKAAASTANTINTPEAPVSQAAVLRFAMEAHFSHSARAPANLPHCRPAPTSNTNTSLLFFLQPSKHGGNAHLLRRNRGGGGRTQLRVSNSDSYLGMWKNAVDREKKTQEFEKIAENVSAAPAAHEEDDSPEAAQGMTDQFQKILEVPKEERDRVQQMQVIDRAAAAIAAARALLQEIPPPAKGAVLSADTESSGFEALTAGEDTGTAEEGIAF
ncbi:hypothetical protein ACLOJK_032778 [Asimina triloba]